MSQPFSAEALTGSQRRTPRLAAGLATPSTSVNWVNSWIGDVRCGAEICTPSHPVGAERSPVSLKADNFRLCCSMWKAILEHALAPRCIFFRNKVCGGDFKVVSQPQAALMLPLEPGIISQRGCGLTTMIQTWPKEYCSTFTPSSIQTASTAMLLAFQQGEI